MKGTGEERGEGRRRERGQGERVEEEEPWESKSAS